MSKDIRTATADVIYRQTGIDILNEDIVSMTEARQFLRTRPHPSTIWRWYKRGVRGVKLETAVVGGRRVTSKEAIQRFVDATTAAHDSGAASPTVPIQETLRKRRAAIERAERELAKAGIPPPPHAAKRESTVEKGWPP